MCGLIVRRGRAPARRGCPGRGSPGPQPTARPGPAWGPGGARGQAGRPGFSEAGPGAPEPRDGGGGGPPGPRPPGPEPPPCPPRPVRGTCRAAGRRGGRGRLLSPRGLRAAAERRRPWPAPYVKRRRLRRHSAEGGRRRAAAAPLRYPATGLSAPPTGRAPYPSAQAPGLHQRRPPRPGPAPPRRPAASGRAEGARGAPGRALRPDLGVGAAGRLRAGAHPGCGASERRLPLRRGAWGCSLQKRLHSAAAPPLPTPGHPQPAPGEGARLAPPTRGAVRAPALLGARSTCLRPLLAASWDGWSGRFKMKALIFFFFFFLGKRRRQANEM